MESKRNQMNMVLDHASEILRSLRPDKELELEYCEETEETLSRFTDFQRNYSRLLPGREYIYVFQMEKDAAAGCVRQLLYVVDMTWDSPLEAAHELFRLLARKF